MKTGGGTRYIVELFIMLVILVFVIVVLVSAFVASNSMSRSAADLTEAVSIAESMAEMSDTCGTDDEFLGLLESAYLVKGYEYREGTVKADYDGRYTVEIQRSEREGLSGKMVLTAVSVYPEGGDTPIYSLDTGRYMRGADDVGQS